MKNLIHILFAVLLIYLVLIPSTSFADEEYTPEIPTVWMKVAENMYDPDGTFEYQGLKPSCSNFPETDSEFYFFAKGGTVNKLVIYLEGGGACWFPTMAMVPIFNREVMVDTTILENGFGLFDLDNPKNPFRNWSVVYIPYCTGDIHIGANDTSYSTPLGDISVRHRGFVNFQAVLEWIEDNFENPRQIFATGSSAGGFGVIWNFPFIKEAFPNSRIDFFSDAGGIVFWGEEDFNMQNFNWDIQVHDLYQPLEYRTGYEQLKLLSDRYPNSKGGIWGAEYDEGGVFFLNVVLNIYDPGSWFPPIDEQVWCDFHNLALAEATSLFAPNYKYYIFEGTEHILLNRPEFYSESSGGLPLYRWLKAMVDNPLQANGLWQDYACPDCLSPCE